MRDHQNMVFVIVGFGSIAKRHATNLQYLFPNAEIIVVSSRAKSLVSPGLSFAESLSDISAIVPRAAFICNAANEHLRVAKYFLEQDIDVFIEKPLASSLDEALELQTAFKKTNARVAVGYNLRFCESLQLLKRVVEERQYGSPVLVKAEVGQYLPDWRPGMDYKQSVSANPDRGGGALLELSHEFDYVNWIFGEPTVICGVMHNSGTLGVTVEDTVFATVQYGAVLANFTLDFLQRKATRSCKVVCENATLVWDCLENSLVATRETETEVLFAQKTPSNQMYIDQINAFLSDTNVSQSPIATFADGTKVLKTCEQIKSFSSIGT